MNENVYLAVLLVAGFIILAQMAIIYGLVNRLIRANGQTPMNAKRHFDEVIEKVSGSPDKAETKTPRIVRESFKVTL